MKPSSSRTLRRTPLNRVLRFDADAEATLASLRRIPDLELTRSHNALWLRGTPKSTTDRDALQRLLASLPAAARYEQCPNGRLRQTHQLIPTELLPTSDWVPIADWFQPELPVAACPATTPAAVPLQLVPSTQETESSLVLVRFQDLLAFMATAACVRFDRLRFATSADGSTVVQGLPIPPLPGTRFSLQEGVAIPAGYTWSPQVPARVLARCLAPPTGGIALWQLHGEVSLLHPEQLLPLTRAAICATAQALSPPP